MSIAAAEGERFGAGRLAERLHRVWKSVAAAQEGRTFLWCPVALSCGIGTYFALPVEPSLALGLGAGLLGLILLWQGRAAPLILLAGLVALGFALAKVKAEAVATPLLSATSGEVAVVGQVERVTRASARRFTVILAPHAIEGLRSERLPKRIRFSLMEKAGVPAAGSVVSFKARLSPLPAPVMPGGFDYGRALWFEGVGATGRITSDVTVSAPATGLRASFEAGMASLRHLLGSRIKAALAEPYASFAEALITGERSSIPPEINRSLLISGLFHILSISGLHMWLVAGGVFWAVRAGLALWPPLALALPIKKWAAGAGLAAGLFYLLLADSGVATARAFIMVAVVFFAVMVDRPALSARNLAVAAMIVLLLEPQAAVEASFQMSFLAVLGLVAFYEAWGQYRAGREEKPFVRRHWSLRLALWAASAIGISLLTSLIAGASSSVPAAYHFGRLSPYGVLANGLAIPLIGFIVMPAALLAVVLMPFGIEVLPLTVLGWGLRGVVLVSDWVAALPGADAVMARPSAAAMALLGAGVVMASLLRGWGRLGVILPLLGGAMMAMAPAPFPDVLVERAGSNVAVLGADGLLVPAHARRGRFSVEKWLAANGEEESLSSATRRPGWACAENRCEASVKGRKIVYVSRSEGKAVDCGGADLLIVDFPLRGQCRAVPMRIDRFDLWRGGAQAVFIADSGLRVETARASQGLRPWVVKPQARAKAFTFRSPQGYPRLD